jgi:hypothetical protein
MGIVTSIACRCVRRDLFAVAALLAAATAQAQTINVAEANSTNDRVYSITSANFGSSSITTTQQNTDAASYSHIQSLAFLLNPSSSQLDLIVADTAGGKIAVYPGYFASGASTTATVIWTASSGGPAAPDGLSVDLAGDLFVVNTSSGKPQLWVFPAAPPAPATCANPLPNPAYTALCSPVRLDNGATFAAGQVLVETTIVPSVPSGTAGTGVANSGDLLVITSNPAAILDFPSAAFGSFSAPVAATTLLPQTGVPLPATPGGLAFWPLDNSLLVTDNVGNTVLRYTCCGSPSPISQMTAFSANYNLGGSGLNMYKVKTGSQSGAAYAFVAQAGSTGRVLLFDENLDGVISDPGNLVTSIAPKGNHPEGLAVINAGAAAPNACLPPGCDPSGLFKHTVITSCQGKNCTPPIVEVVCPVAHDPRIDPVSGMCNIIPPGLNSLDLPVNYVCKGMDSTNLMVIPDYICGASGDSASPQGLQIVKTLVDDSKFNGEGIDSETTTDVANEPECRPSQQNNPTLASVLFGPLNEGVFNSDGVSNASNSPFHMIDGTSGCGSGKVYSGGGSLWVLGGRYNLSAPSLQGNPGSTVGPLGVVGDHKYQDAETTVQSTLASVIANTHNAGALLSSNNTTGCIPLSKAYFDYAQQEPANSAGWTQDLTIAADLLSNADTSANPITCESIITTFSADFGQTQPGVVPPIYNSKGRAESLLAPTYFLINSRIEGNQPNPGNVSSWPPSPAPQAPPSGYPNACMGQGSIQYPPPGGCPTLSVPASVQAGTSLQANFTLNGLNTGCTLTSADGTFSNTPAVASPQSYPFSGSTTGTVPVATAPGNYLYTLSCPFTNNAAYPVVSVSQTVQVTAAPTAPNITVPGSVAPGALFNVSWTLYSETGCTLNSGGGDTTFTGQSVTGAGPNNSGSQNVVATNNLGVYTYTLYCPSPVPYTETAKLSVTEPLSVAVAPSRITDDSQVATITWTAPGSGCKLTDSSSNRHGVGGALTGTTSSASAGSFTAYYKSAEADGGYTITFTASCSSGAPVKAALTVTE